MSLDRNRPDDRPIGSIDELVQYFRDAEKKDAGAHQVGLEHEKLLFPATGTGPVPYDGQQGIAALLGAMSKHGLSPFREHDGAPVIALQKGMLTVSLEPGGQLELSGSPFRTAREAHQENLRHIALVKSVAEPLGMRVGALGYRPFSAVADMPWVPKTRYQIMKRTLPQRGALALDMMLLTATGQVSLDWADEADCARKVTAVARLSPLLVALYANSPLKNGALSGYLSYRSRVWKEVDPTRCGYLPEMIDGTFSYRAYVDWALRAPLLFLRRGGEYHMPKLTFAQLLEEGYEGQPALYGDWVDHLSTLFPEVRIKKVLEVRAADSVSAAQTGALGALWRGLLYDRTALDAALTLCPPLTFEEHLSFHDSARKDALEAKVRGIRLRDLAVEMVQLAKEGLQRLDAEDASLLEPLEEIAASGRAPAMRVLETWQRTSDPKAVIAGSLL